MTGQEQSAKAIVVMGVAGAGKTTVGRALAAALGARFVDADDLHPPANVAKMRAGIPLDDEDRTPWLERVRDILEESLASGDRLVVACSALRDRYRGLLVKEGEPVRFVFLDAPSDVLTARLAARQDHFFDPALLASQLGDLERPADAIELDATRSVDELVAEVLRRIAVS